MQPELRVYNTSAYVIYLLLIFITLFVVFLVLYLIQKNNAESSTTTTSNQSKESSEPTKELDESEQKTDAPSSKHKGFVTVDMMGGLGNQLFQIATAYSYAKKNDKVLILDHRQKNLGNRKTYFDSLYKWVQDSRDIKRKNWHKISEPHFHFAPIPSHFGNIRLYGYFQSIKYFQDHLDDIVRLFKSNTPSIPDDHRTLVEMNEVTTPTVSLHIRRSDYVGNSFHPVQALDYYVSAVNYIVEKLSEKLTPSKDEFDFDELETILTLVIFSDDIDWCKENLTSAFPGHDILYVDSTGLMDAQELILMSKCDHNVIANSSFSWWGAVYNDSPTKIVVAPKLWFNDSSYNWQDIYCDNWIVI